jgi:hypothetical protein
MQIVIGLNMEHPGIYQRGFRDKRRGDVTIRPTSGADEMSHDLLNS